MGFKVGAPANTFGTSIDSSEITDGTIVAADLSSTLSNDLVHISGTETVTGTKTFDAPLLVTGSQSFGASPSGKGKIYGLSGKGLTLQGETGSTVQWAMLEASGGLYHMEGTASALRLMPDASGGVMVGLRGEPLSSLHLYGGPSAALSQSSSDTAPTSLLVEGTEAATNRGNISVINNDSLAANTGGKITFGAKYTGNSYANMAFIKSGRDNATDGNYAGYLSLGARANGGSLTERLRIASDGLVGIGVTPTQQLHVKGSGNTFINADSPAASNAGIVFSDAGTIKGYIYKPGTSDSIRVANAAGTNYVYFDGANQRVGIATASPSVPLDVTGNALITGNTTLEGAVVINEAGADKDVRIEGDTNANLFFCDASLDQVQLGGALRYNYGNTTGAGTALLGSNSPASTLSAPFTWLTVISADGSTVYVPAWK